MRLKIARAAALLGALAVSGCNPPKYVNYWSVWRDWRSSVPWAWNIRTDAQATTFASTNLTGPFAPEFYLGVPSIGVRWYDNATAHTLPDGLVEYYENGDDFIAKTLQVVYPGHTLVAMPKSADAAKKGGALPEGQINEVTLKGTGRKGKHLVVFHELKAPAGARYGVVGAPRTGERVIPRVHEYIVLQLGKGFYVLVYPATVDGYYLYKTQFDVFVNAFHLAKQGPGGAPLGGAGDGQPADRP
jgi:hypothetical protein